MGVTLYGAFDMDNLNTTTNFLYIRLQLVRESPEKYNASTSDVIESDATEYSFPIITDIDQIDFARETKQYQILNVGQTMLSQIDGDTVVLRMSIRTNVDVDFPMRIAYDTMPMDKTKGAIYAAIILIGLYGMIIWEIVHRTLAAIVAATASIGVLAFLDQRPTVNELILWIDTETLLLLFGMMVLVAIISETGIFDYLAVFAFKV